MDRVKFRNLLRAYLPRYPSFTSGKFAPSSRGSLINSRRRLSVRSGFLDTTFRSCRGNRLHPRASPRWGRGRSRSAAPSSSSRGCSRGFLVRCGRGYVLASSSGRGSRAACRHMLRARCCRFLFSSSPSGRSDYFPVLCGGWLPVCGRPSDRSGARQWGADAGAEEERKGKGEQEGEAGHSGARYRG